jgi:cysteine-rich repeat protein
MGRLGAFVALVCASGCFHDESLTCGTLECPHGKVCDTTHEMCVGPDQLTACDGSTAGSSCATAAIAGVCVDGVCLPVVCGDGVVEPPEVCDDGNRESGDGCSADCTSTEVCGNGVVDPGEACDDGNLASHDGCDSRCGVETVHWDIVPIAPYAPGVVASAYDQSRHVLVHLGSGLTWEIAPGGWRLVSTTSPMPTTAALAYDSAHARVVLFAASSTTFDQIWSWDGTTWSALPAITAFPNTSGGVLSAAYDADNDRFLVVTGDDKVSKWGASVGFQPAPDFPSVSAGTPATIIYDLARKRFVAVTGPVGLGSVMTTWEFVVGSGAWSSFGSTIPPAGLLVYDGALGQPIWIGGVQFNLDSNTYYSTVLPWNGSAWGAAIATTGSFSPRSEPEGGYDPATRNVILFSGVDDSYLPIEDVWVLDPTNAWTDHSPPHPGQAPFVVDAQHRLVVLPIGGSWIQNGTTWTPLASGPTTGAIATYVPALSATVAYDAFTGTTWRLDDTTWSALSAAPPSQANNVLAIAYDADTARTVLVSDATYELDTAAQTWTNIAPKPTVSAGGGSLAYDETSHALVFLSATGNASQLMAGTWAYALSPGAAYNAFTEYRRAGVLFTTDSSAQPDWERRGGAWKQLETVPLAFAPALGAIVPEYSALDPSNDAVMIAGPLHGGRILLVRTLRSDLPDETCAPGEDADGDGASGCADPDCWLLCTPQCPFGTSC